MGLRPGEGNGHHDLLVRSVRRGSGVTIMMTPGPAGTPQPPAVPGAARHRGIPARILWEGTRSDEGTVPRGCQPGGWRPVAWPCALARRRRGAPAWPRPAPGAVPGYPRCPGPAPSPAGPGTEGADPAGQDLPST